MCQIKYDAFISYKSEDAESAGLLRAALESSGILCWFAPGSLTNSSTYAQEAADAIKASSVFVLLLSEKTFKSPWVLRELTIAQKYQKTIITYKIEKSEISEPAYLNLNSEYIYENYDGNPEKLFTIVSEIKNVIKSTEEVCENKAKDSVLHTFIKKVLPYSYIKTENKTPVRIFTVFLLLLFFLEYRCLLSHTTNVLSIIIISVIVTLIFGKVTAKLVSVYSGIKNVFLSAVVSVITVFLLLSYSSFILIGLNQIIF